jgi:hypothetical protein
MFVRLFSLLLLSILFVAGCTRSAEQQGEVSGQVTYKGKPLPGGRVTFFGTKGFTGHGIISPQGEYSLKAPLGEVQIAVDNSILKTNPEWEKFKGKGMGEGKSPRLKRPPSISGGAEDSQTKSAEAQELQTKHGVTGIYVPIPARYVDPATSGLKFTVESGSQTHNIELTDNPGSTPGS